MTALSSAAKPVADGSDCLLADLVEDITNRLQAGEPVDLEAAIAAHPEHAEQLRQLVPALRVLRDLSDSVTRRHAAAATLSEECKAEALGDFRILREVGRGGMGIVYEAEQISLGRRVALKVLPFAATMDSRHLQRFQNEAHAAAQLHHTNIVPVYSVGCERGVHYYAMQFIDGQSLAEIIAARNDESRTTNDERMTNDESRKAAPDTPQGAVGTQIRHSTLGLLSSFVIRDSSFFRTIAEFGIQAAEALDYAHEHGIIHRDIKPANMLVDAESRLWITDFGLAQVQGDARMTMTGDLVGTLRYMSPEQALAKRVVVDHRTDVYSLGATLYELLTLKPAFSGTDRQELLRQIAFDEPRRPRHLERTIPAELETIVMKAMEKNPVDRYATALALAEDLRSWLEDRPIRARRPSLRQVAVRWARRHRPFVWAASVVFLVVAVLAGANGVWWLQKRARAEGTARAALDTATRLLKKEKWDEALTVIQGAENSLAGVGASPDLCREVEQLARDLEMVVRLREARMQKLEGRTPLAAFEVEDAAFTELFQWYGLDLDNTDVQAAAERIKSRPIRAEIAAALDEWWERGKLAKAPGWQQRAAIARLADPDPWRNQLRDYMEGKRTTSLKDLVARARGDDLPAATIVLLAMLSLETPAAEEALALLRQAWRRHPDDFWVNYMLVHSCLNLQPPALEEAHRHCTALVTLQPRSAAAHADLGSVLIKKRDYDAAIATLEEAVRINESSALAHCHFGTALRDKGRLDEAMTEFRRALQINKDLDLAHAGLALALAAAEHLDEAIAEGSEAIRLKDNSYFNHRALAFALRKKGRLGEAAAECRRSLELNKNHPAAHGILGEILWEEGKQDAAIAEFRTAIELDKDDPQYHFKLGHSLAQKELWDDAIAEYQAAIQLRDTFPEAHWNLGNALTQKGEFRKAVEELRRGYELGLRAGKKWVQPNWLRHVEQMAQSEDRLPEVLQGKVQPKDALECLAFANICQLRSLYYAAARFRADAFARQPTLAAELSPGNCYNAACSAALAGCRQGKDADQADDKERARLRRQALDWLKADLTARRRWLEKEPEKARAAVLLYMQHELTDKEFNGVRGDEALAKLPEEERRDWLKHWEEVEHLRRRAADRAPDKPGP
jgi:serine/threonine protein kinase/Flp pilus assembly protein TadD